MATPQFSSVTNDTIKYRAGIELDFSRGAQVAAISRYRSEMASTDTRAAAMLTSLVHRPAISSWAVPENIKPLNAATCHIAIST